MCLTFKELAVGEYFRLNGNAYVKRSSRTAYLIKYDRTFYVGQRETVVPIAPAQAAQAARAVAGYATHWPQEHNQCASIK